MSRVVFVGGFGNGRNSAERVGNALSRYFEDPVPFTFSDFVKNPEKVQRAMKGVELVTHSAGALAIAKASSNPNFAYLLNPPLSRSIVGLLGRTIIKTARMNTPGLGIHTFGDVPSVAGYSVSSLAELAAHPIANLGNLRRISQFNALDAAVAAKSEGIPIRLAWTQDDSYFKLGQPDLDRARENAVPIGMFEGEHDEVVLRPKAFLDQVFNA